MVLQKWRTGDEEEGAYARVGVDGTTIDVNIVLR